MENNKYASEKLKKLRIRKNLTQQELAEDLNTSQQQIARYENGERSFKPDLLTKLSEYFNVPISEFFSEKLEENKSTDFVPVYDSCNFKKLDEYIEIPKNWLKNKNNVFCVKLKGDIILYKNNNKEYIIFERQ